MENWNKCPKCKNTIQSIEDFCPKCGEQLTIVCKKCGEKWRSYYNYNFCKRCGTSVKR